MDSLTHIALGACVGDVLMRKHIGRKALVLGAIANSIPDIDFLASFWLKIDENLLAHRGFTHSILFALISTFILTLLCEHWFNKQKRGSSLYSFKRIKESPWLLFWSIEIFLHLFLDALNNYGTGWFEPFSHYRVAFNVISVVDPFFSVWLGIAAVALLCIKRKYKRIKFWQRFALGLSICYIMYCFFNKSIINGVVKNSLNNQHIVYNDYFTTPTLLNNWLWYIVVSTDSGYYIGYRSTFDTKKEVDFTFFRRNKQLLSSVHDHVEVQNLKRFSKNFYTVEYWGDTLVFNDLRFGQIAGWQNPQAKFIFHYFLQHPTDNDLVVQRGRFMGWDRSAFNALIKRIQGN